MTRLLSTAVAVFMLSGCTVFQPPTRSSPPLDMPGHYSLYTACEPGPGKWWRSFGSTELDRFVDEALSNNFDIRTAWSRVQQADAIARQVGATMKPTMFYTAGAERSGLQTKEPGAEARRSNTEAWSAGLGASYEIDLWGRLRALRHSEALNFQAAREDLESAAVTVSAEVAFIWIDILTVCRQIEILQDQIENNRKLMDLQQLRFTNGKASALDVSQQREALAAARAKLPLLQLAQQQQLNALAVLLGRSNAQNLSIAQETLPELIPLPSTGLPADLLAARPDVRAAGLRLRAADWQVSAARTDRLPAITLSADAAFYSEVFDLLFENWAAALAASLTGPLIDGGYRSAEVDRSRAVAEASLAEYARTVSRAIREVEDDLATEKRQGEYIELLTDQLEASRLALKNARIQYTHGQKNYLDYLIAWTSVQDLERQLVQERGALVKNRVDLYRSLGGDWTRNLIANDISGRRSGGDAAPQNVIQNQM